MGRPDMGKHSIHRLSARAVETAAAGYRADGGGLYLQVSKAGAKSWVLRYERGGRRREMGLGSLLNVSLATARKKAAEARALLGNGIDPLAEKQARLAAERGSLTFREAAEAYIAAHAAGWRNAKHGDQWRNTLATYAYPAIGDLSVKDIDTPHVLKVLEPIWTAKTETATRVRGRIESILDWATARKYRDGENPARWRGHIDKLLPKPGKVAAIEHFAALPYAEVPAFLAALKEQQGIAAQALAFCILTATRTGEVIGARWDEIAGDVWTIPAERTKARREHRVPLSKPALAILDTLRPMADLLGHGAAGFIFPGGKPGKPLSNMAMLATLKRMGREDVTTHGFRSAFRDWCGEQTNFPREVAEAALAHVIKDKAEAAYARGDLLAKRAQLMAAWGRYCTSKQARMAL
jgi:integrase